MHFLADLYPRHAFPLLKTRASFVLMVSDVFFDFFGILDIFLGLNFLNNILVNYERLIIFNKFTIFVKIEKLQKLKFI